MTEWKCFVGEKHTFYGIYCDYYEDIAAHWDAESTQRSNYLRYCNQIIPLLPKHDETAISSYTREDYEAVIQTLVKRGQDTKGKLYIPYKESTLQIVRRLMYSVVSVAAKHGECDNVLWESSLNPDVATDNAAEKATQAMLSKSLTIPQELAVANALLSNPLQSGQHMGLMLMYSLGLRNAEACAVDFSDIKPMQTHPECMVAWIYKTTGYDTNATRLGGKTQNADRIIPLPDKVADLIQARRQHLERHLGISVENYPIVCIDETWETRCSARQLTAAARLLFQNIEMQAAQLASITEDLEAEASSPDNGLPFEECKDPTAYLFRRNFGTHLHILGLSEPEIEYIIGHDIEDPYETRNEFINEEKLFRIKQKMGRRPLVNSDSSQIVQHIDIGSWTPIDHSTRLCVPTESCRIEVHLTANEPTDNIEVNLATRPQTMRIQSTLNRLTTKVDEYERSVDTQQQYCKRYSAKSQ